MASVKHCKAGQKAPREDVNRPRSTCAAPLPTPSTETTPRPGAVRDGMRRRCGGWGRGSRLPLVGEATLRLSSEILDRLNGFAFSPDDPLGIQDDPRFVFEKG